jgi:hypothetical protein
MNNELMSVEDYLIKYSVLDGNGNMDGMFVPLSIALLAVELYKSGQLDLKRPSHWGGEWPRTLKLKGE